VCAEVYHFHPDELTPERMAYLLEIIAARAGTRRIEREEYERARQK